MRSRTVLQLAGAGLALYGASRPMPAMACDPNDATSVCARARRQGQILMLGGGTLVLLSFLVPSR